MSKSLGVLLVDMHGPAAPAATQTCHVQSEKAKVFHSRPKCGSSTCHLTYDPGSLPPHLRPCKRCVLHQGVLPLLPPPTPPPSLSFECFDCARRASHTVKVDNKTADIECDCDAFEEGDLCPHLRFVLTRVMGCDRWMDMLYEYGGFEGADVDGFLSDLAEAVSAIDATKRRCFACLHYVNGLHIFHEPSSGRVYHKECFHRLSMHK